LHLLFGRSVIALQMATCNNVSAVVVVVVVVFVVVVVGGGAPAMARLLIELH